MIQTNTTRPRWIYPLFLLLLITGQVGAFPSGDQVVPVTGTVIDEDGFPLIGVTVVELGTSSGTVTDIDGNYSITVSGPEAVLRFTYVGSAALEEPVAGRTVVDVILQSDAAQLDEVVVVGYGTQRKSDVTGSLSQLEGDELVVAPTPNLSANLAGKLTGVIAVQSSGQPGFDDASFQIRGRSTLGNNNPLILVDGVERSFSRINPAAVASVTALKDAASTAVYGSRAANGVLLITTKRGRVGKPRFHFDATLGSQSPAGRPELMDANEYVIAYRQALLNEGTPQDQLPLGELLDQARAGTLPSYDWWNETLTNSAPQRQYNVSVDGGSENLRYFFAYGRLNQQAFLENAGYNRDNVRSNVDADIAPGLTLSFDLAARLEDRLRSADGDGEFYSNVLRANPLNPVFLDGIEGAEGLPPRSLGFDGFSGNAFGDANLNGSRQEDFFVFQSNFQLNYAVPFVTGLSARGLFSYDATSINNKVFVTPYTVYQRNESTGEFIPLQSDNIRSLDERRSTSKQLTTQLSVRYERNWKDHFVSGLALFEQIYQENSFIEAYRDGFISPTIQQFFAGDPINDENNGSAAELARRGYVGRVNYGYKNRYLLQANFRVDKSSIFPENNRTGYFPAFSAGWRISEEPWMQSLEWLSTLKIRGSWGITGNDRIEDFQFLSGFQFGGGYVLDNQFQPGIGPGVIANPDVTWERAKTTDIGMEADLLEGKFGLEVDYYQKRTEDILVRRNLSVPLTFGARLPFENLGIVDSWGWEFSVRHRNNIGQLGVRVNANLTLANNEVVFADEPDGANPAISLEGNELGVVRGYLSDGLYQTQQEIDEGPSQFGTLAPGDIRYRDINGRDSEGNLTGQPDGVINDDDRVIIGESSTPNLIYGFNFSFDLAGFKLDLNWQGASQYAREIAPRGFLLSVGNNFDVLNDSWTEDNRDARYPRILPDGNNNNNQRSDFFVENLNFLRLRNARLAYDFGEIPGLFDRVGFESLSLSLSGTNLLTFSNVSIGDPEGENGDALFYPIARVVSVGLQLEF